MNNKEFIEYENEIAYTAINMIINNEWSDCEEFLLKYKDVSPLVNFCYGFFSFTKSVFLFEELQFDKALKDLEHAQKMCKDALKASSASPTSSSSIKRAFGISSTHSTQHKTRHESEKSLEDSIDKQIILADCKLFIALLTLARQDLTLILTTGIFELRKAWKIYSNIQRQLYNLFKQLDANAEQMYGTDPNKLPEFMNDDDDDKQNHNSKKDDHDVNGLNEINESELGLHAVKSLLAKVSFGFGIIQLSFSFLQPSLLKLLKFIGLKGDRSAALKALFFCSQHKNIRSSFADMIICMYSTVVKQLCGYSETDMHLSYNEIQQILDKNLSKNPKSCLFLLYKAKSEFMNKNIDQSLEYFLLTQKNISNIRELETITWYEIGFIHMLSLDYNHALEAFTQFGQNSKWSQVFNNFLICILNGSLGNLSLAEELLNKKVKLSVRKNPIESYSLKRIDYLKKLQHKTDVLYQFFCIELTYLWVYLPYAKEVHQVKMLEILYQQTEKAIYPLSALIEASIRVELGNYEFAEQLLKESIARIDNEKQMTFEKYAPSFAYLNLSLLYIEKNEIEKACFYLNKIKQYKDYDHEDRLQLQVRTANRRIEYKQQQLNNNPVLHEPVQSKQS